MCFFFLILLAGRRSRIGATTKGQLKASATTSKRNCTSLRKMATDGVSDLSIEAITQRTRNLRKSLHKIQKQFDNQAITNFFQRTLKANAFPEFGGDNDENACDAFTTEQLTNSSGNNNDSVKIGDNGTEEFANTNRLNVAIADLYYTNGNLNDRNINGSTNITMNSIQPTNIFLQKPVLHLNIDKSPNQPSSIVINKQLDVCPNFATSFTTFNSSVQNTANNNNQNKSSEDESSAEQNDSQSPNHSQAKCQMAECEKPRLRKRRPRKCATRWMTDSGINDVFNDSDSNSCDSGVVSDRSFELSSTDSNKPTTPHRIVCPSTSTPTHERCPKMPTQLISSQPNTAKGPTVKRVAGKQKR